MKILSIETSCDDTAISIMEAKGGITNASFKVLANNSNSQIKVHVPYGGVYPILAKREHKNNLPIILEASLKQANLTPSPSPVRRGLGRGVDAIAVTYGPGLEMCLWEGVSFAKNLAKKWNVPLIPVNHMEGHVLSVFGKKGGEFSIPPQKGGQAKIKTPILSLLVSGGHTQLVLTKKWMQYEIIGETLDDAVGEAFDKVARMLDLPYPGGPQISKLAEETRTKEKSIFSGSLSPRAREALPLGSPACETPKKDYFSLVSSKEKGKQYFRGLRRAAGPRTEQIFQQENRDPEKISFPFSLPRPMLHSKNFDFSFAGLKTAVLYLIKKMGALDQKMKSEIALEFENAAIECLVYKTKRAIEKYGAKTLIVAGGVACNTHLQREMKKVVRQDLTTTTKIKLLLPAKGLAGDNSLMIGIAGYLNYMKNKEKVPKLSNIKATGNLRL